MTTVQASHVVAMEVEQHQQHPRTDSDEVRRCSVHSRADILEEEGVAVAVAAAAEKRRGSSVSECSVEMDLECGLAEIKVHLAKIERDCRICHLSLDASNHESGIPIELGCSCKDDLAAAHKHCAEAWFKIKGDITCEICGSIAHNVTGTYEADSTEQRNEPNEATTATATAAIVMPPHSTEARNFWQGHSLAGLAISIVRAVCLLSFHCG
ncbi:E3 ubiquitin-protein ligase MARCH8 [Cucumis melo var. makuwa]|uniref:E3 ubiquitin-protein ligase MARCH8 n=1 Tax=Cucumis melo var. makuwa TaxID=1194695 RepID=A0A5A7TJA4_CUCMM|nr:E3 ubiquitin-protein ligase MARCH8 [Cucumis melo var. makuwa]TYK24378.1 E3 ubiquitin-protein ligase MARCH8 [Cucumis melo var. makuwa]